MIPLGDWIDRGACTRAPADLFFAPDGERKADKQRREDAARAICRTCPVVAECLDWAMRSEEEGIWGGTTDDERRFLRNATSERARQLARRS